MSDSLIWLHEDALRLTHPVVRFAPGDAEIIHIWDDSYLREAGYSLKRLVFLYETLCQLAIPIVRGDTLAILQQHAAGRVFVPSSPNPWIHDVCGQLARGRVHIIREEPFAVLERDGDFRRFFQYWSRAQHSVFLRNGGADGQNG